MTPAYQSPPQSSAHQVLALRMGDPLRWLRLGLADAMARPGTTLFYGLAFWAMALVLGATFRNLPQYTMSLASGCLLVGPFLAMGLYDVSRRRELGQPADFGASLLCWDQRIPSMGMMVLLLLVLELLWGRASLVVFAVFFQTGSLSTAGAMQALLDPANLEFIAVYTLVGGVFAALVFSTTAVSLPMILDRDTDAITAGVTSFRVVYDNTAVMLLWGAIITALVVASLLLWGAGLVIVGPVLGHATWHAYRAAVKPGPDGADHAPDESPPAGTQPPR